MKTNVFNAAVEDMIIVVEDQVVLLNGNFDLNEGHLGSDPSPLITACTGTGAIKPNGDAIVRNVPVAEYQAANATAGQFSLARVTTPATVSFVTFSAAQSR